MNRHRARQPRRSLDLRGLDRTSFSSPKENSFITNLSPTSYNGPYMASFFRLPVEIMIIILASLNPSSLLNLSLASRYLNSLVQEWGWSSYLRFHPALHGHSVLSGSLSLASWHKEPRSQVRYIHLTERGWRDHSFVARPLNNPWNGKLHPIIALHNSGKRIAVAAGNKIYAFDFQARGTGEPTRMTAADVTEFGPTYHSFQQHNHPHPQRVPDITGFTLSPSMRTDGYRAFVGFENGVLQQIELPEVPVRYHGQPPSTSGQMAKVVQHFAHPTELIRSLSSQRDLLLTYTPSGLASIYSIRDEDSHQVDALHTLQQPNNARGWVAHLDLGAQRAALGSSSPTPLLVYAVRPSGFSQTPIANLGRGLKARQRGLAVYGITGPPPGFPAGQSDQILISAWFDGKVRIHDLRSGTRIYEEDTNGHVSGPPTALIPCQVLYDPWTVGDPKYSVSAGGPASACIASGSAYNSVACLWDVRQPLDGWSVHAPGNDRSPIYSIILDHSRVWCANQARACVIDFGPDITLDTYPALPRTSRSLLPKPGTGGLSYLSTSYSHVHFPPRPRVE